MVKPKFSFPYLLIENNKNIVTLHFIRLQIKFFPYFYNYSLVKVNHMIL